MRNSCATIVARTSLLYIRLYQSYRSALRSLFGEQKSIHRGKFVVISFGEHFLLFDCSAFSWKPTIQVLLIH